MKVIFVYLILGALFAILTVLQLRENKRNYWTGRGDSHSWYDNYNWSKGHIPLPSEDAVFDNQGKCSDITFGEHK